MEEKESLIEDVTQYLDEYLLSKGKTTVTLKTASELLRVEEKFREIDLKSWLESGKYPYAYQTSTKPKQWYISFSTPEEFEHLRNDFLNERKKELSSRSAIQLREKNRTFSVRQIIVFAFVLFLLFNFFYFSVLENTNETTPGNEESVRTFASDPDFILNRTQTHIENHSEPPTIELPQSLKGKIFTFKSTYYDIEERGEITATKVEDSYDTFDFEKLKVTQKILHNGKYITISYPMNGFYIQRGILTSTYVIVVGTLGVNEIWFNFDVPNYGYDFLDGTRIACYGITRVE